MKAADSHVLYREVLISHKGYRSIRQLTNSVTRRFGDKAGRFDERLGRFGNTIGRFVDNFTNSVTGGSDAIE